MDNRVLQQVIEIRKQLISPRYDKGQISGAITVSAAQLPQLILLSQNDVLDEIVTRNDASIGLSKIRLGTDESFQTKITLFTKNIKGAVYYETIDELVTKNQERFPEGDFYIHQIQSFSSDTPLHEELLKYKDVLRFIEIITSIADYAQTETGEAKTLIFFEKKKLVLPIIFINKNCRKISFLDKLQQHFVIDDDKDQRVTIFKSELISNLSETPPAERFGKLLTILDTLYDNYLKSFLLYIEKFSYHDLKAGIDKDKLDYTKKIYGTVNDVQAKLIAVPAAFLLVLSQFDFTGILFYKNLLIVVGAVLFSILLEILLMNQFGLLRYIEKEILHFKDELKNKDTTLDLNEFIQSFADLAPVLKSQRIYLWIFRIVVWLVPALSIFMIIYFSK